MSVEGGRISQAVFLGATKHLYNWLCPSVGWSVGWSVTHLFDDPHGAPYWPTWPTWPTEPVPTVYSFSQEVRHPNLWRHLTITNQVKENAARVAQREVS